MRKNAAAAAAFVVHTWFDTPAGSVVIGGVKGEDVEQAMRLAVAMRDNREPVVMAEDYADTNVSVKVVKLIQSYTKIVNETVWLKR